MNQKINMKKLLLLFTISVLSIVNLSAQTSNSLSFDGTNDYATSVSSAILTFTNNITVEGWFKTISIASQELFYIGQSSANGIEAGIVNNKFYCNAFMGSWINLNYNSGPGLNDGAWHHFAVITNGTNLSGFVDGISIGSVNGTAALTISNAQIVLGSHIGAIQYLNGSLDEIRVWNRSLCITELSNNKNCQLTGIQTGLKAYYKLNEGVANGTNTGVTSAIDASGNSLNATLYNFALTGSTSNWTTGNVSASCSNFTQPITPTSTCSGSGTQTISVVAAGTGYTYQWRKGGVNLTNGGVISGATTATLTLTNPTSSNEGSYDVVVSSCAPTITSNAVTVTVNPLPSPTISASGSTTFCTGNSVTLTANSITEYGNSLTLNGSTQKAEGGAASALNTTGSFTVEAWIYHASRQTGSWTYTQEILGKNQDNRAGCYYLLFDGATGNYVFFVKFSQGDLFTTIPISNINLNTWSHIAGVFDNVGKTTKIYVNGNLIVTNPVNSGWTRSTYTIDNFAIGNMPTYNGYPFNGKIDEVRVWSTARTAIEINAKWNKNVSSSSTGLIANWKFDETSGTTLYDKGPNSINLTLIGSPSFQIPSTAPITTDLLWSPSGETTSSIVVSSTNNYSVQSTSYTGCTTTSATTSVTVNPLPQGSLSGNTFYTGGIGQLTFTSTSGVGPFSLIINGVTYNSISSGVAFNASPNPNSTTAYTLTSITDNNSCVRTTGITGATTNITVISTNADLSALSTTAGAISPAFASGTISYTASVINGTTSVTVTATRSEPNATLQVQVNGGGYSALTSGSASSAQSLNVGANTIDVRVTAQDGSTIKTYTITVTRAASNNADLSALTTTAGTISPTFAAGTISYTASVINATTSVTVTATRLEPNATLQVRVNGGTYSSLTSGSASSAQSLNVGANTIDVRVTAQDGTTIKTYTITVTRAGNTLDNIGLTSATLSTSAYSLRLLSSMYTNPLVRIQISGIFYDVYADVSNGIFSSSAKISNSVGTYNAAISAATSNSLSSIISPSTNAKVAVWYDQSGNNNNALHATTLNQPTIISSGIILLKNGLPSILFDSVNSNLRSTLSSLASNSDHTLIAVSQGNTGTIVTLSSTPSCDKNSCLGASHYPGAAAWFGGYCQDESFNAGSTKNSIAIRSKTYTASTIQGYLDGANIFSNSSTTYNLSTADIVIGAQNNNINQMLNGSISEVIVFTSLLNNSNRQIVENNQKIYYQNSNADLSALTTTAGTISPTFAAGTTSYTASVINATTSVTVTATRSQANATLQVQVNGGGYSALTSGSASSALSLNVGANTIDVRVTAQDGSTIKIYTITVTRDCAAPAITTQPSTPTATCNGSGTQTMTVVATGTSLTYQWRKGGTNISNGGVISGATTTTLTLTNPTTSDAGSYDVVISGTCTPSVTSTARTVAINTSPAITTQPTTPTATCSGSGTQTMSVVATGTSLTYQWRKGGTNISNGGVISGATTATLTLTNPTTSDAGSYDVVISGTCTPTVTSTASTVTVNPTGTWLGLTNDWSTGTNWCGGVPVSNTNVAIAANGLSPVLTSDIIVNNLSILSPTLSLGGNTLTVNGTLTGSGTITGSPTSNLTISSSTNLYFTQTNATTRSLNNLTVNAGSYSTLINPLNIYGTLDVSSGGSLSLFNQPVTLKAGNYPITARVGNSSTLTGATNVTTERSIPVGRRGFRLLSSGVTTTNYISNNWQLGMHITGSTSGANGFDVTQTGSPNMYTYTPGASLSTPIINTNATNLNALQGYKVFVYGDRTAILTVLNNTGTGTQNIPSNATTLTATGTLQTSTVTYNSGTLSTTIGNYALIANPYWSPVNWGDGTNGVYHNSGTAGISSTYYIWDPTIGNRGQYVSYNAATQLSNGGGAISKDIQPGQAIFVQTTSATPTIEFKELNKTSLFTSTFRSPLQTPSKIIVTLKGTVNNTEIVKDAATVAFRDDFFTAVGTEDSYKFSNSDENIAFMNGNTALGLEARPTVANSDIVPIRLWRLYDNNTYKLELNAQDFDAGVQAYLKDKFTNTQTAINMSGSLTYPFTFTGTDSTSFYNRFEIVFTNSSPLPVNLTGIKAYRKNTGIQVEWNVTAESAIKHYEVERSENGDAFSSVGTVTASANNGKAADYNWFDASPNKNTNYYRIKVVSANGEVKYSSIVKVGGTKEHEQISVYPNPLKGDVITLQLGGIPDGRYEIQLYSTTGQQMMSTSINKLGAVQTQTLDIPKNMSSGVYRLSIRAEDGTIYNKSIIKL